MTSAASLPQSSWISPAMDRYRSGGLAGRLVPRGRVAVLVVDLQTGFTDPASGPGFDLTDVVGSTAQLAASARAQGVLVLYTTIAFDESHRDLVWLQKMPVLAELRRGSGWDVIDARLGRVRDQTVVLKQTASAFAGTGLAQQLRREGIGTVVVTGATTSGCVRATAVDACAADFATYVVRECVGDREAGPHEAALFDLHAKYADVISLDQALALVQNERR